MMKSLKPQPKSLGALALLLWGITLSLGQSGSLYAQVVINEILADNQGSAPHGDGYPDYIELCNASAQTAALGGMSLTDDLSQPRKYVFPSNLQLAPGGCLIVWCDAQTNSPGLHSGFGLNTQGETIALFNATSTKLDSVDFGLQLTDLSLGRVPNGLGAWALTVPTPAMPNRVQPLGNSASLKINEWMANATPNPDWIELYNAANLPVAIGGFVFSDELDTAPTNRPLPALSFIKSNGFIQFLADNPAIPDAGHLDFKLNSTTGETISLYDGNKTTLLDRISFGPQTLNVSQGRLPDGGTNWVYFGRPTPAASNFLPVTNLVVNELLIHTDPPLEDAVEFYNPTTQPVDIGNWWLSNHQDNPMRYRIPAGTTIAAGGYRVFYEYQFNPVGLGFTFNSYEEGEVVLCSGDASGSLTGYRLRQAFEPAENGISLGRFETSAGVVFTAMSERTFGVDAPTSQTEFRLGAGKTNAYAQVGPVIINELMFHPPDLTVAGMPVENTDDEYIELYNATNSPTPLFDPLYPTNQWRIRKAVSFDFPSHVTLQPRSYLLLVSFNPSNTVMLAAFRSKYRIADDVPVFGPYAGKLSNRGDTLELLKPDPPQAWDRPKPGMVPYILVDRLEYQDRAPWPETPDDGGHSLQRRSPMVFGNDPGHWLGAPPTPGEDNAIEPPRIESCILAGKDIFKLQFTALAGVSYAVERQAGLTASSAQSLTNIQAALFDRRVETADKFATNNPACFYRIRLSPQP